MDNEQLISPADPTEGTQPALSTNGRPVSLEVLLPKEERPTLITEVDLTRILGSNAKFPVPRQGRGTPLIISYMEALASMGLRFRMSELGYVPIVGTKEMTDHGFQTLRSIFNTLGYPGRDELRTALITLCAKDVFNPMKEFFTHLTWDERDHMSTLASYFDDRTGMFPTWLKRWTIGCVARVFQPHGTQNRVWILMAPQGLGKSSFVRWLGTCGPLADFYREGPLDPTNKDDRLRLLNTFINEIGEIGFTWRRADREALKFYLT